MQQAFMCKNLITMFCSVLFCCALLCFSSAVEGGGESIQCLTQIFIHIDTAINNNFVLLSVSLVKLLLCAFTYSK